jgi:regulator of nucleoside diphosphate kinase
MRSQTIVITQKDMTRLSNLIEAVRFTRPGDEDHLSALERELDRAEIMYDDRVPPNVITMNSHVRVTDLETGREHEYKVVYPREADPSRGKISVLAPIGTALLGCDVCG